MQKNESPPFARAEGNTVELRGECPRKIIDVLDAVSHARDMTRTALVNQILGEYTAKILHEVNVVNRVVGFNPTPADAVGDRP